MPTYKKNFLDKVILRVDFEEVPLINISKFIASVKAQFPKSERKLGYENEVTISFKGGDEPQQIRREITIWKLNNKNDSKRIEIASRWITLEYDSYTDSNELLKDAREVVDTFIEDFEIKVANRVGLRYVNLLKLNELNATDWSKYLNKKLLGMIDFSLENKMKISRTTGQIVQHDETRDLTFNFGLWNSDYPNVVTRKEFVLDYDCYTTLPTSLGGPKVSELVGEFNKKIELLFEASITDGLRKILKKTK